MFELIIGKAKTKKTKYIKEQIKNYKKPIIILDYKNYYTDIEGEVIDIGTVNPFKTGLSYKDAIAVNAGILEYQSYLSDRAKDVLKDYTPETDNWETYRYPNLIQEAFQRCAASWNPNETLYTAGIKKRLYFNKAIQTKSLDDVIEQMKNNKHVILKTNGLHSAETRILTFLILRRYLDEIGEFLLISDNINNLWGDGHLFLFMDIFDFKRIDAIFSFNKTEKIPKKIEPFIDKVTVFRLDSNKDYQNLKTLVPDLPEKTKHLNLSEFITFPLFNYA